MRPFAPVCSQQDEFSFLTIAILTASLIGTVVSSFKMLLPHMENYLGIDSVWGAPRDPSDKIQHWTNTSVGELVVMAQRCDSRLDEHDAVLGLLHEGHNCQQLDWAIAQIELLEDAFRKHVPAAAGALAAAPAPLPPSVRKLSILKSHTQKFVTSAPPSDATKPLSPPPSMRVGHDIELLVAVSKRERDAGADSRSVRLSFAAPLSVRTKPALSVTSLRAPSGRVDDDDQGDDNDNAYRYVAMRESGDDLQ
jgi:hypothetical protein